MYILFIIILFFSPATIGAEDKGTPFILGAFNDNSLSNITPELLAGNSHEANFINFLNTSRIPYKIKEYSWLKGMRDIQTDPNLLLFGVSRTKEREEKLKWILPLYHLNFHLYGRKEDDKTNWTRESIFSGKFKISCVRLSNACEYLRSLELPEEIIFEFVSSSPTQPLDLLDGKRVDFLFLSEYEMATITELKNITLDHYPKTDIINTRFAEYLVGNKNIDPALVTRLREAAQKLGYNIKD